jgi:hypothetical protein
MNIKCDQLDEYLDGLLSVQDNVLFEQHARQCAACRREIDLQRRIGLAASRAAELVPVPARLARDTRVLIRRRQRLGRIAWSAGLAAALLVAATLSQVSRGRVRPFDQRSKTAEAMSIEPRSNGPLQPPDVVRPSSRQQLEMNGPASGTVVRIASSEGRRQIAVPRPTENPRLTFVMVYTAIE